MTKGEMSAKGGCPPKGLICRTRSVGVGAAPADLIPYRALLGVR